METTLFYRFAVALFIGILVGLQREYTSDVAEADHDRSEMFAGVRTFALMALVGSLAAMLADILGEPWVFVGIILPLGILIAIGYFVTSWNGSTGMTTEVAALATILTGALCYWGELVLAVALGVIITVLLSLKVEMQRFVAHLTRDDILAALKFAVITAIILPLLPNQDFGPSPFDIFNPYQVWLFVVLISGISFLGYVLMKLLSAGQGISLTGLLGGLASSTATTLSFAQRSQNNRALGRPFALAIILAWVVMFARAFVEVATVNFDLIQRLWVPMAVTAGAGLAYATYLFFSSKSHNDEEEVVLTNPFELGPAITFALLYVVVLFISHTGQTYFGTTGVYISSVIGGLPGIDAVALSMAELSNRAGGLDHRIAARAVMLAALANTVAKGGLVLATGSPALKKAILPGLLLMLGVGGLVTILM